MPDYHNLNRFLLLPNTEHSLVAGLLGEKIASFNILEIVKDMSYAIQRYSQQLTPGYPKYWPPIKWLPGGTVEEKLQGRSRR